MTVWASAPRASGFVPGAVDVGITVKLRGLYYAGYVVLVRHASRGWVTRGDSPDRWVEPRFLAALRRGAASHAELQRILDEIAAAAPEAVTDSVAREAGEARDRPLAMSCAELTLRRWASYFADKYPGDPGAGDYVRACLEDAELLRRFSLPEPGKDMA